MRILKIAQVLGPDRAVSVVTPIARRAVLRLRSLRPDLEAKHVGVHFGLELHPAPPSLLCGGSCAGRGGVGAFCFVVGLCSRLA